MRKPTRALAQLLLERLDELDERQRVGLEVVDEGLALADAPTGRSRGCRPSGRGRSRRPPARSIGPCSTWVSAGTAAPRGRGRRRILGRATPEGGRGIGRASGQARWPPAARRRRPPSTISLGQHDGVGHGPRLRRPVADDADALDAEEHGPAVGLRSRSTRAAGRAPGAGRSRGLAVAGSEEPIASTKARDTADAAAFERLEHDVAGEAVGDDDVDVVGQHVAALDVADEVRGPASAASSSWVAFTRLLPFIGLLADRQEPDPRLAHAVAVAEVDAAHLGELHEPLGLALGVGAGSRAGPSAWLGPCRARGARWRWPGGSRP